MKPTTILTSTLLSSLPIIATADDFAWNTGDGDWTEPLNWDPSSDHPGSTPGREDNVDISNSFTVSLDTLIDIGILRVGDSNNSGRLVLNNGADLTTVNAFLGNVSSTTTGFVNLHDNSNWTTSALHIGRDTNGVVTADGGSSIKATNLELAVFANSTGSLTLSENTSLTTGNVVNSLVVGNQGNGTLILSDNAQAVSKGAVHIGRFNGSQGTLELIDNTSFQADDYIRIGYQSTGTINISESAELNALSIVTLGDNSTGSGTMNITGGNFQIGNDLRIGYSGTGIINVSGSGQVDTQHYTKLGDAASSSGTLDISGGTFNASNTVVIGINGNGALNLSGSGVLNTVNTNFTEAASGIGIATLTGGTWTNTNLIRLGTFGTTANNNLNISGGQLDTGFLWVGNNTDSGGRITLNGSGQLDILDTLSLGRANNGEGYLDASSGTLSVANAYLGTFGISYGEANISGDNVTNINNLYLGYNDSSQGKLTLSDTGILSTTTTYLGTNGTSYGEAEISSGNWTNTGSMYLGFGSDSEGKLTLTDTGELDIIASINVGHNGTGTADIGGKLDIGGNLGIGDGVGSTGIVNLHSNAEAAVNGSFLIVGNAGTGSLTMNDDSLLSANLLVVGSAGSSNGTLTLNDTSILTANTIVTNGSSTSQINFNGGTLKSAENTSALFHNFKSGEVDIQAGGATIDTNGYDVATSATFSGTSGSGTLTKTGSGSLTLTGNNTHTGGTIVNDGELFVHGQIDLVTVNSGGTLGGSGTVGTINLAGGIITPGTSPGTLTAESLNWTAGHLSLELGVTSDLLALNGALDGSLSEYIIHLTDNGIIVGQTYDLISFDTTNIDINDYTFTSDNSNLQGDFSYTANTLQFTATQIPEPTTPILLTLASTTLLLRRKRK